MKIVLNGHKISFHIYHTNMRNIEKNQTVVDGFINLHIELIFWTFDAECTSVGGWLPFI